MSIDLKTVRVDPIRRTFDHLAEKLGPDKKPTRYQEAVWGLQPEVNFHYRPTWQPELDVYDPRRTAVVMQDFDDLIDPRQYYYGTWTIQRGRQQDSQDRNFTVAETRGLLETLDEAWKDKIKAFVVPIRHIAWAANTNNSYIGAYGFGAPVTSACAMHMIDHLGIAQYITRIALILGDGNPVVLDDAKEAWMSDPAWQPMRALVEESMVVKDWFELFLLQNFLIDGTVHPLVFDRFDKEVIAHGGAAFSMLTEYMVDWYAESTRWVDAVLKRAAAESDANKKLLGGWVATWSPRVQDALRPLADFAFDAKGAAVIGSLADELTARAEKAGLGV
jgi:phenol/toluene 2-monooxygenase (NADH) P1/A1